MSSALESVALALAKARHAVALTGAGVSTESGLPDFRSPQGLWTKRDPFGLLSRQALELCPDTFYREAFRLLDGFRDKEPNPGHRSLAELEHRGVIKAVITQNIDGLHQKAGSMNVVEVHGDLRECVCVGCGQSFPWETLKAKVSAGEIPPSCPKCDGLLRPRVVLFDEEMPPAFGRAVDLARASDFLLVVGSSLQVAPAAYLPKLAEAFAIINLEPTPLDDHAAFVLRGKAGELLPELTRSVSKVLGT